ncbi:MAG: SIMPL domain-containing protein [Flavobacteriales bacterium]|nr:SIMPL domain-containing protein [Flavobacteriales bacterium]
MEKSNSKALIISALILAIGLSVIGLAIQAGIVHFKDSERVVSVKGLSEMEVKADRVIWPLMYKEVGQEIQVVYSNIESSNKKIVEFLTSNGIPAEQISISPAKVIDMEAEQYNSSPVKYRYNVTQVIIVASDKVDLVRQLMARQSDLLRQGIAIGANDYQYNTSFQFTKLNEIKPEMIQKATQNARQAAEKFATDSQSTLGKIKYANQGQFSITDRDENTPYLKTVRVVTTVEYYLKD